MTEEQRKILSILKMEEEIVSLNYWENFKFYKDIGQSLGGKHPKVKKLAAGCEEIRQDWHTCQLRVKEFLRAIGEKEEGEYE